MKLVSIRVDEDLWAAFQADCGSCGVSASERLREFMRTCTAEEAWVAASTKRVVAEEPWPEKKPAKPPAKVTQIRPKKPHPVTCKHANVKKLPYGVWCEDCNARLR